VLDRDSKKLFSNHEVSRLFFGLSPPGAGFRAAGLRVMAQLEDVCMCGGGHTDILQQFAAEKFPASGQLRRLHCVVHFLRFNVLTQRISNLYSRRLSSKVNEPTRRLAPKRFLPAAFMPLRRHILASGALRLMPQHQKGLTGARGRDLARLTVLRPRRKQSKST
jgi:hypothetical protein